MLQVEKQNITTTRTLRSNTCNGKGVKKRIPVHKATNHTKGPSRPQTLLLDTDICGMCSRAKSNTPQVGPSKAILQLCVEMQTRVLEAVGWPHHPTFLRLCLLAVLMSSYYFQFQKHFSKHSLWHPFSAI